MPPPIDTIQFGWLFNPIMVKISREFSKNVVSIQELSEQNKQLAVEINKLKG
jgi:hypothetical protein